MLYDSYADDHPANSISFVYLSGDFSSGLPLSLSITDERTELHTKFVLFSSLKVPGLFIDLLAFQC